MIKVKEKNTFFCLGTIENFGNPDVTSISTSVVKAILIKFAYD
jgi:hypothetical protein